MSPVPASICQDRHIVAEFPGPRNRGLAWQRRRLRAIDRASAMARSLVRLRIDFAPGRALGPGKVGLLEAIARTGSLLAAAGECGMSYKRAWTLLQGANELFGAPLARMSKGGRGGGGGATVTALGRDVIAAFRQAEGGAAAAAQEAFAGLQPAVSRTSRRPVRPLSATTRRARRNPRRPRAKKS
jgi:molybdate transport system regulatory protein